MYINSDLLMRPLLVLTVVSKATKNSSGAFAAVSDAAVRQTKRAMQMHAPINSFIVVVI
jgi:hypothetical protein